MTSGVGTLEQETERLGQFSAPGSGGWANNNLVPMKTASGTDAVVKLEGEQTVRFTLGSGDFDFLIFSAAAPPPPFVASAPLDSSKRNEVMLSWTIQNTDISVDPDSIEVFFGADNVSSDATVTETDTGVTVDLDLSGTTYEAGEYTWRLVFEDEDGQPVEVEGNFVVNPYPTEGVFVIEAEDFNYSEDGVSGGLWNPQEGIEGMDVNVMPYLGGAYNGLSAVEGVDYNNNDGNDSDQYRTELDENGENEVNIGADTGNRYSVDRGVFETTSNWRIGWVAAGEWQNYTREFPEGAFEVWAAMSYDGRGAGQLNGSLDLVTSDPTEPDQTVERLGSFNAPGSGGWGRNELVPMKNDSGQIAVVEMGGVQTVRFNLGSGDVDYMVFVPTAPVSDIQITDISLTESGALMITWTGGGTLETAESLEGPWSPVAGATSPHTFTPTSDVLFIRVRQ